MSGSGEAEPLFVRYPDLVSERLGGRVLAASDEFFAPKENLLKSARPVFDPDRFTDRGKWMDGWETRRRRTPGNDWCVIRLGLPGILRGVNVDTRHFRGNHPERAAIDACEEGHETPDEDLLRDPARIEKMVWRRVVPESSLAPGADNFFGITGEVRATHVRLNIYPDGGVARLRVHGEAAPDWSALSREGPIDLASIRNGGIVLACSDERFGSAAHLLLPDRAPNMGEGWETGRRRGPGHDWVVIRLGRRGTIRQVEIDTAHFKGNYPESFSVDAIDAPGAEVEELLSSDAPWIQAIPRTPLAADEARVFDAPGTAGRPVTHVRLRIYPDGGVSRLRVLGEPIETGEPAATTAGVARLNGLPLREAEAELRRCCGAAVWAHAMAERRPFRDLPDALAACDEVWRTLSADDWLQAIGDHPRIGGSRGGDDRFDATRRWSRGEQAGVARADIETRSSLAEAQAEYERRFGYIFLVCAAGKSGEEILGELRARLHNLHAAELRASAEELWRITRLRLEKLCTDEPGQTSRP
ncbi:MAG TPA: allantoicase [Gemmatimonadota bacterium]|nr:allantoicase [Gemmatimonadota bacterium]